MSDRDRGSRGRGDRGGYQSRGGPGGRNMDNEQGGARGERGGS